MSKPIKNMVVDTYKQRFGELKGAVIIELRGVSSNETNQIRQGLREKDIRVSVVKNTLAQTAMKGTDLEALVKSLQGASALAYGSDSVVNVARELVAWAKKIEKLQLKAAVLDGILFEGAAGVLALSKYPTREEAQATVVQLVLSPAKKLAGAVLSPGSKIAGALKTMQEKLEKGEKIAKVG